MMLLCRQHLHCHHRGSAAAGRLIAVPPALHQPAVSRRRRTPPSASLRRLLLIGGPVALSVNPVHASAAIVEQAVVSSQQDVSEPEQTFQGLQGPPTYVTATGRIVAIGDLHGDWNKAIDSLSAAGVITITASDELVWTGGDTVVVQLGDVLDRGDHEIAIVNLFRGLDEQARKEGGAVYMLNGNHESLNICGDFRYVTPNAFLESARFAGLREEACRDWELLARVRYAVYKPGGPMGVELSKNPTVLVVNDTAFAHGGLLPIHAAYGIERLNQEVSAWMRADKTAEGGKAAPPFHAMGDANSVMWTRTLSREQYKTPYDKYKACNALRQALERIGAKRLVVGHTPQLGGANCECDGCVWRIDVGMSAGVLNRPVQVLEIARDPGTGEPAVKVLPEYGGAVSSLDDEVLSVEL